MRLNTLVILTVAIFCACGAGPASPSGSAKSSGPRVLFVSLTGSDGNPGTISAPWLTLRYAVGQLKAGDTLYLREGVYTGAQNSIDSELGTVPSGTSWSNPITIAAYQSEVATIQPPRGLSGFAIRLTTTAPRYLIFQDLVIDMRNHLNDEDSPSGIYLSSGANHNRFLRLEVRHTPSFGVLFSPNNGNSPFNEIIDCNIHDNGASGGSASNGHGMYISTSDNLISGNDIHDNQGYGVHLYDNGGPLNVARNILTGNRIHGNGRHGGTAYGVVVAWGDRNRVDDNLIYDNPGGILAYTNSSNAEVKNNIVYGNGPLEGILIQYATGTVVNENAVYSNETDILDLGNGTVLGNNRRSP